ncbi:porin [Ferrimonas balearica]|uniref:porin n=1 Tax=Ferrimonas balearica TaxID=44012 RepID=UPI001C9990AA|nr:porin [Ferrimonas balearica]MBY5921158.1 porin [Ferrimonas balearica]MBY5996157.1 porin [Ferrimonas balearica]
MRQIFLMIGLAAAAPASAISLYDDNLNRFSVGGHLGFNLVQVNGDTELLDSSTRIRFLYERSISREWNAEALMEWGFNAMDSGSQLTLNGDSLQAAREGDFLFNRLGFLAFEHDTYGRFSAGKQWSVYYDVASITDNFIMTGGLASGTYNFGSDGGLSGTGRADSALQYRNEFGGLSLGLQYQARTKGEVGIVPPEECIVDDPPPECAVFDDVDIEYDDSYGASLRYRWQELMVGVGYNRGDFDSTFRRERVAKLKDEALILGASYGTLYQPGLYLAANYAETENHEVDNRNRVFNARGYEVMLNWTFANNLTLVSGLNWLESDDSSYEEVNGMYRKRLYVLGAHYEWGTQLRLYFEAKLDDSEFGFDALGEEDLYGIGARFFF